MTAAYGQDESIIVFNADASVVGDGLLMMRLVIAQRAIQKLPSALASSIYMDLPAFTGTGFCGSSGDWSELWIRFRFEL